MRSKLYAVHAQQPLLTSVAVAQTSPLAPHANQASCFMGQRVSLLARLATSTRAVPALNACFRAWSAYLLPRTALPASLACCL